MIVVDDLIPQSQNLVAGANESGYHLKNTNYGRDYSAEIIADLVQAKAGDACKNCGSPLSVLSAISLATRKEYDFQNILLALAETHHDAKGLTLPHPAAPFDVYLMHVPGKEMDTHAKAEEIYQALQNAGISVLFDDRDERAGVKFNDADLIGCPIRVTVGEKALKEGMVELKPRKEKDNQLTPLDTIAERIKSLLHKRACRVLPAEMNNPKTGHFPPDRRLGLFIHAIVIAVLAAVSVFGLINLSKEEVGPFFVLYLLISLLAFVPIPFLGYRAYALLRADYYIDRDSLAMLWGLRIEDIPLSDIEWVRPASDLTRPLLLPPLRLPGAILGTRRHPDLGLVEFIASNSRNLILIATSKRIFAISPRNAAGLVQTFARATEMGSLTPTEAKSVYPSFIITQAWDSPMARFLWISGILLNLGLIAWVGLLIPSLSQIPFGFNPFGASQRDRSIHAANSASFDQRLDVYCGDDSRIVFLSLGPPASAGIHCLEFEHPLCDPVPSRSSISCFHTDINANPLRLSPCSHRRLPGIPGS